MYSRFCSAALLGNHARYSKPLATVGAQHTSVSKRFTALSPIPHDKVVSRIAQQMAVVHAQMSDGPCSDLPQDVFFYLSDDQRAQQYTAMELLDYADYRPGEAWLPTAELAAARLSERLQARQVDASLTDKYITVLIQCIPEIRRDIDEQIKAIVDAQLTSASLAADKLIDCEWQQYRRVAQYISLLHDLREYGQYRGLV